MGPHAMDGVPHLRRVVPPHETDNVSEIRSMSSGSSPPSSPDGSPLRAEDAEGKQQFSGMNSAEIYALYQKQQRDRRARKQRREQRKAKQDAEEGALRSRRLMITFLCYCPAFLLWGWTSAQYDGATPDPWWLPIAVAIACLGTASAKEGLQMPQLAQLYPLISFGVGVVNGCFSEEAMLEQKSLRLLAVCAHGVLAGRLRHLESGQGQRYFSSTGLAFWVALGEGACMLYRDVWAELGTAAAAYAMLLCLFPVAAFFPTVIMSVWVWLFGVEAPRTLDEPRSLVYRLLSGAVWVISASIPIVVSLAAASSTFYIMAPLIWERMVFVAPWGILFEVGSLVSCGEWSKSLFYAESALTQHSARPAVEARSRTPPPQR